MIKVSVTLTASKIMAFMILLLGAWLGANTFMFAVPFSASLILGKQYIDKEIKIKTPTDEITG